MSHYTFLPIISIVLFLAISVLPRVSCQNLTGAQIDQVSSRLADAALLSWELGTRCQAVLESNASSFSVFSSNSLPPSESVPSGVASGIAPVFTIAKNVVSGRAASNKNITGPQPLISDASAGDPASIGVAVLLANWTNQGGEDYAGAAQDQLNYLLEVVPKTSDGAISHRVAVVQLWSDFIYMVPPFLAYYGVLTQNVSLVTEAYTQISLYRSYLRDTSANNLWKHIQLGPNGTDDGHWSTGNGWAAAGMLRVLATIQHSQYAKSMQSQQQNLTGWVKEIHSGIYPHLDSTSIFGNYPDQPINGTNFYDASSTALLASTVYRLALLAGDHTHLPFAEKSRKALVGTNSSGGLAHFTADGYLTPVVNPHNFVIQGNVSAEGQAFVVEMQAAWGDWVAAGSRGANGAVGVRDGAWWGTIAAGVASVAMAFTLC